MEKQAGQATPPTRVLLIVDQFEEIYTHNTDHTFVNRLLEVETEQGEDSPKLTVLITMRTDFMRQALSNATFSEVLNQNFPILLGQMNRNALCEVIEKPAKKQGLVDRILYDLGEEPGNLPLLEFALNQLWERQQQHQLTHQSYHEIEILTASGDQTARLWDIRGKTIQTFTGISKSSPRPNFSRP